MNSLSTLPKRAWQEQLALTLAVALVVIGTLTLIGWWFDVAALVQPFVGYSSLKINTALAFVFLGMAAIALEKGKFKVAWVAVFPTLIGALSLFQSLSGQDFHLDESLGRDRYMVGTEFPGRMSLMTAVCLMLSGGALMWRASEWGTRDRSLVMALAGSILAAVGFSTLLGYANALSAVYSWGTQTATPPLTAVALLCLGTILLLLAWRESVKNVGEAPAWSPMPAVIGCLTLTLILWIALRDRDRSYLGSKTQNSMDQIATELNRVIDFQTNQIERVARQWGDYPENAFDAWQDEATRQLAEGRELGLISISFVNPAGKTEWVYPREQNEAAIGFDHRALPERAVALTRASSKGAPSLSATTPIRTANNKSEKGAVIYAPIFRTGRLAGYLATEFTYASLFKNVIAGRLKLANDYQIIVSIGRDPVYTSNAPGTATDGLTLDKTYTIADRRLQFSLTPSDSALADDRRYLPGLALGAGFGITILLGLSVHLARSARAGQRAAEQSNRKLFAENEERRRIEARLKVSDERLRLALDSTQIGIFEWSVGGGQVYYSPGLWAMLGYEHGRMPSTVEAWQSLIHPDDLPLYSRRTESQLEGVASFIEPEYRVRARSGDWRWVYTRAKSVATGPDGRPTRIIGTVQDITARREAELALRESQAEARKLSLVASKTDNPVLIGSPDGRIEWANEAFCRVMEYNLEEVIGRNPAHFMLGPETNLRTLARIRAALPRGQGISTDLVNYSKSGRRYHLHLEIQPVRSANGVIENFIVVGTDITSRVETELQLRQAKLDADDASRAKSEFLASMSHEIRTPMNGVIGMTSLLMDTRLDAEQRDFVNTIRTSGEALLTIINDILDFSKIESGKMDLERAPFDLTICLEEALDLFALQASAKNIEIGYHAAADVPPWIMGDVTRLRQVIVNLVNNAVKFTPSGSIALEVRRLVRESNSGFAYTPAGRMTLEFTVRDTGIGIPTDRVDRLFKAFSQVDSSTTRKYGGTGLGLAICQRLTELMGGSIRVISNKGGGSAFVFTIKTEAAPLSTDAMLPPLPALLRDGTVLCLEDHAVNQARLRTLLEQWGTQVVIVRDATDALRVASELPQPPVLLVVDTDALKGSSTFDTLSPIKCPRLILFPFGQTPPTALDDNLPFASISKPIRTASFIHAVRTLGNAPSSSAGTAAKKVEDRIGVEIPLEVLLAEDNMVNQKVALRFLERLGYRADAVANGLEAVNALEKRRYDLVLMDVQMPEMDGYEATRQIRARLPADRQPKIIALTANAMQGDREMAIASGMDDHVSKPVKMHEIADAIRRHFGRQEPIPLSKQFIG